MRQIFCFVLVLSITMAKLRGQVSGRVAADGNGLPYVVVTALHTSFGAYTDDTGHYTITGLAPGTYTLQFSATGYQLAKRTVLLAGNDPLVLNINLQKIITDLDEVTVTGVTHATTLRRNPVPISVLTMKDLSRNANSNIIDAIVKGVPGVSGVTTGPNITKPFVRGLGYNRVLTLYDGIRQEGQQWGDEHGIEADPYAIERVEVIKGPASLIYGSDAIAGVINMLPATPPAVQGGVKGSATAEYQTNNGTAAISAGITGRNGCLLYTFRTSAKAAHDYQNAIDGLVYNTGYREIHAGGTAGVEQKWGKTRFGLTVYNDLQEIPDGSRDSLTRAFTFQQQEAGYDNIRMRPLVTARELNSYNIATLHQYIRHYRLYNQTSFNVRGGDIALLMALQQNNRQEFTHPTALQQPGLSVTLNTMNYAATYNYTLSKHWTGALGVNGMYQQNNSRQATDYPIPNYHLVDVGAFAFFKRSAGHLDMSGGIRYDTRHTGWDNLYTATDAATGFSRQVHYPDTVGAYLQYPAFGKTYTGVSGSIGATFTAGQHWLLKANAARGYRAPNITESGSNGLDPGAHIVYLGNRNFVPEFSFQQDMGVMATYPQWSLTLELFNNHIDHYIYQARAYDASGNPIVISPGNVTYQYQQSAAQLYGAEVCLKYKPINITGLELRQMAAYTEGHNRDASLAARYGSAAKYLPLLPPLHLQTDARYLIPLASRIMKDWNIGVTYDVFGKQGKVYAVEQSETITEGYQLWQASSDITFVRKSSKELFHAAIVVENIFNTAYQSHLNRLKYFEYYNASANGRSGIYNMGRNVCVRVSVPF